MTLEEEMTHKEEHGSNEVRITHESGCQAHPQPTPKIQGTIGRSDHSQMISEIVSDFHLLINVHAS
jgi:hypothetical protein